MTPLRIALVIPGRFHGFDLARALLARGHDVTVLTNYPKSVVEGFGVPAPRVRSFLGHGALVRGYGQLSRVLPMPSSESWSLEMFGRWAARELRGTSWDIVHCWSGAAEELLEDRRISAGCRLLMRGSAHIEVQSRLLIDEEARAGVRLDRPSAWIIDREQREYQLADQILTLSTWSYRTFIEQGVAAERLSLVPLGVDVRGFRPSDDDLAARQRRLMSGAPLRVLYVGHLSMRKGAIDLVAAIRARSARIHFTLVGEVLPEAKALISSLPPGVEVTGKLQQATLAARYHAADVFMFPTIEDGFPQVLAQAKGAGLPIITTAHGAGLDIVTHGRDGWIVPIRDSGALVERLDWCDAHRAELAAMTAAIVSSFAPRDWSDVAADFEAESMRLLARRSVHHG
ncbi:MAG TPA: glycosyltransferase family 4 protein [Vicinamibacterales bacterium]|nr:glycosyltransferase family 4 protein [Vicinamibacterales bacterium]